MATRSSPAAHHGLIRRGRALELGATSQEIREWRPVHPGIYRHEAVPVTSFQTLLAAVWAGGSSAMASHRSAAWLWSMLDRPPEQPEITVPVGWGRRLRGVVVHQSRDLATDCSRRQGIATTNPLRTLVELGAVADLPTVEMALDRARAARLVTFDAVAATLDRFGRQGRNGTGVLRAALAGLGSPTSRRSPSVLESRLDRVFIRYGLETPVAEVVASPRGEFRIDRAYPHILLGIEAESFTWHGNARQLEADRERQNTLVEYGWTILRFGWRSIQYRPDSVAGRIRAVHDRLSALL